MIDPEALMFAKLMDANDSALRRIGRCESMRFTLVVWCDCSDGVLFSGANEADNARVAQMLRESAAMLDNAVEALPVAGHA